MSMHVASLAAGAVVCLSSGVVFAASDPRVAPPPADLTEAPYFVVPGVDPRTDPLPLREVAVHADISGVVADVTVTQLWENTGTRPLDATYVFPLSTRAAVHALEMRVGGRRIVASIREKEAAREEFEAAQRAGLTATLLEQRRPNVFSSQVANVQPGDVIEVELRYVELLRPADGVYALVVPEVVGPRYVSPSEAFADVPWSVVALESAQREPTLAARPISVSLRGGMAVQWVQCMTHPAGVLIDGDRTEVELVEAGFYDTQDFVLEYGLASDELTSGVLVQPDAGGDGGHFLALVEPPYAVAPEVVTRRDYVFIVDTSGSMSGWPLAAAKGIVRELVAGLERDDRLNVITFAGGSARMAPRSVAATAANRRRAERFLDEAEGGGGTELLGALEAAFATPDVRGVARTFVLVSDGFVTVEPRAIDLIRARAGSATVFAVGVGGGVNRHLIEAVAHAGGGEAWIAESEARAEGVAEELLEAVRSPILTDVSLSFEDFDVYEVEPRGVPTLYRSRPLVVTGRYRGAAGGALAVSGRTGAGLWRMRTAIAAADAHPAVPLLWARERIATLSDFAGARDAEDNRAAVTELGLAYSLVTRYTSFVAVDEARGGVLETSPIDSGEGMSVGTETGGFGGTVSGFVAGHGSGGVGLSGSGPGGGGSATPVVRVVMKLWSFPGRVAAPAAMSAIVRRRLPALRTCLGRIGTPRAGTLGWSLIVAADGSVARVGRASGTFDEKGAACAERAMARLRFEPAEGLRRLRLELEVAIEK